MQVNVLVNKKKNTIKSYHLRLICVSKPCQISFLKPYSIGFMTTSQASSKKKYNSNSDQYYYFELTEIALDLGLVYLNIDRLTPQNKSKKN